MPGLASGEQVGREEDRLHDLKEVKAGGEKETQLKWLLDIRIWD